MHKVYRVNMHSGMKTEIVSHSIHGFIHDFNQKELSEIVNDWNRTAALQSQIKTENNSNNGPLWLYYWE